MPKKAPKKNAPLMTAAELGKLAQSYAPEAIKGLRQMAKEGSSESVRKAARRALVARGISVE
jgi:hypothetical protein